MHERIGFESRGFDAGLDHPQSAVGENRPLERLVRLKAYNDLIFAIDIAGLVGEQRRRGLSINREHSLLSFVGEVRLQFCPNGLCALRWPREKVLVPRVRLDVPDDEIANVDGIRPTPGPKAVPAISATDFLLRAALAFMVLSQRFDRLPAPAVDWNRRDGSEVLSPGPRRLIYVKALCSRMMNLLKPLIRDCLAQRWKRRC